MMIVSPGSNSNTMTTSSSTTMSPSSGSWLAAWGTPGSTTPWPPSASRTWGSTASIISSVLLCLMFIYPWPVKGCNCVSVCSVSSSHHHQAAYKRYKGWAGEERGGAKYLELAVASPRPAQLSFVFMCKYAVNMSLSSAYGIYRYIVHSILYTGWHRSCS